MAISLKFKLYMDNFKKSLTVIIESAPDEWDRLFNVDFLLKSTKNTSDYKSNQLIVGIQLPEIFKEYSLQAKTHLKFTEVFGGKVFYLFSVKVGEKRNTKQRSY